MMPIDSQKNENLPDAAVAALWQGKKIDAIKIVREAWHIDLKAAKDAVEEYVRVQPALQQKFAIAQADAKSGLLWLVVLLGLSAAAAYYWLTAK